MTETTETGTRPLHFAIISGLLALFAGAVVSIACCEPTAVSATGRGRTVAIASAAPEATEAGLAVFAEGGNVVDAAIAVTFAISVARPQSTGLGGGGFFLVHDARTGEIEALDTREVAPASATADMYRDEADESLDGPRSVAVPTLVAGVLDLHARKGTLPLPRLLAPAIKLAREGVVVAHGTAGACSSRAKVLARDPEAARIFLPGGKPLAAGALLVQSDLANTIEALANGARFSDAPFAAAIEKATNGAVTRADLAGFKPTRRAPVRGTYRGRSIVSFPPPSSGGVHLVQMLNVLETFEYGGLAPGPREHALVEAMRRAYRDRAEFLGDPDFVHVPVTGLTSKKYAKGLAATIDPAKATLSSDLKPGPAPAHESDHTTHFSVVDSEGNAVASTQTINYTFGSCVVAPGTGVLLNDEMDDFAARPGEPNAYGLIQGRANAVAPGKRPLSSMTPTFVFEGSQLTLALGSPGGSRIITAVLQVILNRFDLGLDPAASVAAPRLHHQWMPDEVTAEQGVPATVVEVLRARGHKVKRVGPGTDIQAVFREPGRGLLGVSDPRAEGKPGTR